MLDGNKPQPMPRYDRERWLEAALNALAEEGGARLRIDALAKRLGVTKGSFYHHFRDRNDFVSAVADYWADAYTDAVIAHVEEVGGDGRKRMQTLIETIQAGEYDRYDIAFRSWAAQDSEVAERVRRVDEHRYEFVRRMFSEMGFEGAELETRVRAWLVFVSAQRAVYMPEQARKNMSAVDAVAFFTRP